MSTTLIEFDHQYTGGTSISFTAPALLGDLVVIMASTGEASTNTGMGATDNLGNVYILAAYQGQSGAGPAQLSCLASVVTIAGTITISLSNAGTDCGMSIWLLRGETYSSTPAATDGNVNSTATMSLTTAVNSNIFVGYANENASRFVSFLSGITQDNYDSGHVDANGHILDAPAGTYTVGANLSGATDNAQVAVAFPALSGGATTNSGLLIWE